MDPFQLHVSAPSADGTETPLLIYLIITTIVVLHPEPEKGAVIIFYNSFGRHIIKIKVAPFSGSQCRTITDCINLQGISFPVHAR